MVTRKKGGFFKTRKRVRSSNFRTKQEFKAYKLLKKDKFKKSTIIKEDNKYIINNAITFKNNSCVPFLDDKQFNEDLIIRKFINIKLDYGNNTYNVDQIFIKYKKRKGWQSCVDIAPYYKLAFKLTSIASKTKKNMILYLWDSSNEVHENIIKLINEMDNSRKIIKVDKSFNNLFSDLKNIRKNKSFNMTKRYNKTIKKTNTFFKPEKIRTRINGPFGYNTRIQNRRKKKSFFTRRTKKRNINNKTVVTI